MNRSNRSAGHFMPRLLGWCAIAAGCAVGIAATPTEQRAIVQTGNGGPEVLKLQFVPVLEPAEGQVLIRVYAAAVNPIDWKIRQGMGSAPRPPAAANGAAPATPVIASTRIPGFDVAGVVEKAGPGVSAFKAGQAVVSALGMVRTAGLNGGYAEFTIAAAENVVAKPATLTYAQAAGLGTAAVTGARSIDQLGLAKGKTVLITGVAGGVGSSAAQVALAQGLRVVGTATARHSAYLRSIGVTNVLDYTSADWAQKAQAMGIDAVFDTAGGDSASAAFGTLKRGGSYVGVGEPRTVTTQMCKAAGVRCLSDGGPGGRSGPSQGEVLKQVANLVAQGKFSVHVDKTYPLDQAADAQEANRAGHTEGKIIIAVTDRADSK